MEHVKTVSRHRLYLAGAAEGYPEGTVLVFRERLFRRSYKPGMECAAASSVEEAQAYARALFGGMRLEELEVQMRDARRESEEREGSRSDPARGGGCHGE